MNRLLQFTQSPMFDTSSQHREAPPDVVDPNPQMPWDHRREQMNAFSNARTTPMIPGSPNMGWAPPVSYMPMSPGNIPPFFTQETYSHFQDYKRGPSVPLDPTVAPEVAAQFKGATLQGEQWQRQPNVHVRTLTDSAHNGPISHR